MPYCLGVSSPRQVVPGLHLVFICLKVVEFFFFSFDAVSFFGCFFSSVFIFKCPFEVYLSPVVDFLLWFYSVSKETFVITL